MLKVQISEDALGDLEEGFWFYEEKEIGPGEYFKSCLSNDIERLKVTGGIHRTAYKDFYRSLSHVFPYSIYYSVEGNLVIVWAVVDCRRSPSWIQERLRTMDTD